MRVTRTRTAVLLSPPISGVAPSGFRYLGIDPSLTSTGYAYRDIDGTLRTGRIRTDDLRGPWRLSYIRRKIEAVVSACNPTHVGYEDYAMGFGGNKKQFGRVFHLGELGGVLKTMFWEKGIDVILIGPTVLKVAIVGKSGSKKDPVGKEHMVQALARHGYRVPQFDEADAAGLMLCAEWKTDTTTIPQNQAQSLRLKSLNACETIPGKLQSISKFSGT